VGIPHVPLDLRLRHQGCHRVDHDDVEGAGTDQHVGDLEGLLPRVRLGDEQGVGVHAELLRVLGVEGVLGIDEGGDAAQPLGVRDGVERHGRLPGRFRAVDLDDAAPGQASDAERDVEGDGPGGDDGDRRPRVVPEPHDRPLAEILVDLRERCLERLRTICHWCGHGLHLSGLAGTPPPTTLALCSPPSPSGPTRRYARPLTPCPARPHSCGERRAVIACGYRTTNRCSREVSGAACRQIDAGSARPPAGGVR